MILITGAVGNIGQQLVKLLGEGGHPVRVLVRKPEKYRPPFPNIEVALGHLGDRDAVLHAVEGVDRTFLLSGVRPDMVELQCGFLEAAKSAGVQQVVRVSGLGAGPRSAIRLGRWHGEIDTALESSRLSYTHLRPNVFMQNFLYDAANIASKGSIEMPCGDAKVSFVDVRDIAEIAALCLTSNGHEGKSYSITGPTALSYDEAAQSLALATGRPIHYVNISLETARAKMIASRVPPWWADLLIELYSDVGADHIGSVHQDFRSLTGKPPRSFLQFAQDHKHAFSMTAHDGVGDATRP